jgi:hypothetical protein
MMAAFILVVSVALFLQFSIDHCRSILATSRKFQLSERVREITGISGHDVLADDFFRLLQLVRLCPEQGDDQADIRVVGTYYSLMHVVSRASHSAIPRLSEWAERERQSCSYFAAVALDRRISNSRDMLMQHFSDR